MSAVSWCFVSAVVLFTVTSTTVTDRVLTPAEKRMAVHKIKDDSRGPIPSLDLTYGIGSHAGQPVEFPAFAGFRFFKERNSGSNPKFEVIDAIGKRWRVKMPFPERRVDETRAEVVANRFLWSMGYFVEETYFRKGITIQAPEKGLPKGQRFVEYFRKIRGSRNLYRFDGPVSFKAHRTGEGIVKDDNDDSNDNWDFADSKLPFYTSDEYDALLIFLAMINHWDNHAHNNEIVYRVLGGGRIEAQYLVADVGQTFGRTEPSPGWEYLLNQLTAKVDPSVDISQWSVWDYMASRFVSRIRDGTVFFHYTGKRNHSAEVRKEFREATVRSAELASSQLNQLSDRQIHQMFDAAQTDPALKGRFIRTFKRKIAELDQALDRYRLGRS